MKFFILVYFVSGVMEATYTVNKNFFIYEVKYNTPDTIGIPLGTIKKKIIDFKEKKVFLENYGDSTIYVTDLNEEIFSLWTARKIDISSIEESPPSIGFSRLGFDCIRRITNVESTLGASNNKIVSNHKKLQFLGSLDIINNYLPDSKYIYLLRPVYVGDNNFCFESYSYDMYGRKRSVKKITNVQETIIKGDRLNKMLDLVYSNKK